MEVKDKRSHGPVFCRVTINHAIDICYSKANSVSNKHTIDHNSFTFVILDTLIRNAAIVIQSLIDLILINTQKAYMF